MLKQRPQLIQRNLSHIIVSLRIVLRQRHQRSIHIGRKLPRLLRLQQLHHVRIRRRIFKHQHRKITAPLRHFLRRSLSNLRHLRRKRCQRCLLRIRQLLEILTRYARRELVPIKRLNIPLRLPQTLLELVLGIHLIGRRCTHRRHRAQHIRAHPAALLNLLQRRRLESTMPPQHRPRSHASPRKESRQRSLHHRVQINIILHRKRIQNLLRTFLSRLTKTIQQHARQTPRTRLQRRRRPIQVISRQSILRLLRSVAQRRHLHARAHHHLRWHHKSLPRTLRRRRTPHIIQRKLIASHLHLRSSSQPLARHLSNAALSNRTDTPEQRHLRRIHTDTAPSSCCGSRSLVRIDKLTSRLAEHLPATHRQTTDTPRNPSSHRRHINPGRHLIHLHQTKINKRRRAIQRLHRERSLTLPKLIHRVELRLQIPAATLRRIINTLHQVRRRRSNRLPQPPHATQKLRVLKRRITLLARLIHLHRSRSRQRSKLIAVQPRPNTTGQTTHHSTGGNTNRTRQRANRRTRKSPRKRTPSSKRLIIGTLLLRRLLLLHRIHVILLRQEALRLIIRLPTPELHLTRQLRRIIHCTTKRLRLRLRLRHHRQQHLIRLIGPIHVKHIANARTIVIHVAKLTATSRGIPQNNAGVILTLILILTLVRRLLLLRKPTIIEISIERISRRTQLATRLPTRKLVIRAKPTLLLHRRIKKILAPTLLQTIRTTGPTRRRLPRTAETRLRIQKIRHEGSNLTLRHHQSNALILPQQAPTDPKNPQPPRIPPTTTRKPQVEQDSGPIQPDTHNRTLPTGVLNSTISVAITGNLAQNSLPKRFL